MKKRSLMNKSLTRFIICVAILLVAATPLFYLLTKNYYAEDVIDLIEAMRQDKPVPAIDLEEDILHGIVIQFALIATVLGIAIVLTLRLISKRLWQPFDKTLEVMETFRLENGVIPALPDSGIEEFSRLNDVLNRLMTDSLKSYRAQKEFTENASHELQTPLAVFQSKLDLLLQQPDLTGEQAVIIQDLYQMSGRLSGLNRNLLLLAKMENGQLGKSVVDVVAVLDELRPYFDNIADGLHLRIDLQTGSLMTSANRSLLESLLSNLVVNAVRHNRPDGEITITLNDEGLTVANTSDEAALDKNMIFGRFYRPSEKSGGNGLGLAIVKAICEYHRWNIAYAYRSGCHVFTVTFAEDAKKAGQV